MSTTTLAVPCPIVLNKLTPSMQTVPVAVDKLTDAITVRIRRPTSANGLLWDAFGVMRVTLVYVLDGVEHRCVGQVSGGIRLDTKGDEIPEARLTYHPTVHRLDATTYRRIGETAMVTQAYVILERIAGVIQTDLLAAETTASPAVARM